MIHPTRRAVLTWVTCCAMRKCAWYRGAVVVCRVLWCCIIGVSVSMKGKNKMIKFNAYVIELEEDTWYKVCIEDLCKTTVRDNGYFDDIVITFESALATVIECSLSNDYDYVETDRCLSKMGRRCRKYVISVDNGD